MTAVDTVLQAGMCVCGRPIPDRSPSDWACGEPCQSAWLMHQADPEYPHPRQIREAADRRATAGRVERDRSEPATVPEGTEIDVDGTGFVRVGSLWQQTGPWSPLRTDLHYRRWCPRCQQRRLYGIVNGPPTGPDTDAQVCQSCEYHWPGRPLIGMVETRGEPWPGVRLRLTDGFRSAVHTVSEYILREMSRNASDLFASWIRLERNLSGGYADQDQASELQRARGRSRIWDWRDDHVHFHM